jgi:molybdopterin-guanine dinucleotide biosynthesis protein A
MSDAMSARCGIVLCGGRSSRMGRAKAWLPWGGRPMLAHVVERLAAAVDEVVVVAAPDQLLPDVSARIVRDVHEGLGPLAGIREGLSHATAELCFVTATDAPYLSRAFVETVLAEGRAAAPVIDGYVQALSAAYPRAGAEVATVLLEAGKRRPLDLLEHFDFVRIPVDGLPDVESVRGFNTPDEYLAAVRACDVRPVTVELMGRARVGLGEREREVAAGSLRDVLAGLGGGLELIEGERVARPYAVSLAGRAFVRDLRIPIGPGEHVIVLDASAGG